MGNLKKFIRANWKNTIKECKESDGTLIPLPKPFTIPSIREYFQEMYYWDTYFTNVGLLKCGMLEQAKNNCENMSYMINKYGFFPNGNRTYFLVRSQPPYFAFTVKDIYDVTGDDEWIKERYPEIKKEYFWWMKNRATELGLNRYGDAGESIEGYKRYGEAALKRLKTDSYSGDIVSLGKAHCAVCESGWDCSPRFDDYCMYACPVDLNANLWYYETFLDKIQKKYNIADGESWSERAEKRKMLIDKYLWNDEKKIYLDYNFVTDKQFDCLSAAAFHPYYVGLADNDKIEGLKTCYDLFVQKYGVACTDSRYRRGQWSYPQGWAPIQVIAYVALKNYGLNKEAESVAEKYVRLIEKVYEKTGDLFEKYNVVTGTDNTCDEGKIHHTMMGWTAGAYVFLSDQLKKL